MAGIEMKGRTFGRLKVLERHHSTPKKVFWTCQCKCGQITVVDGWSLRSGETKSCGCLQCERAVEVGRKDMTGQTVNGIKVLEVDHKDNRNQLYWKCVCPYCGKIFVTRGSAIRNGHAKSCGCYGTIVNTTHNMCYSKLYHIHQSMLKRCNDPTHDAYPNYGGRGIYVCDEWSNKGMTPQEILKAGNPGFMNFYNWAMKNGYKEPDPKQPKNERLAIERKDVNGPYAPWNCVWIPYGDQAYNRRNTKRIYDGKRWYVHAEFEDAYGLTRATLSAKLSAGWSESAIVYAAKHPDLKMRKLRWYEADRRSLPKDTYVDKDDFVHLIPIIHQPEYKGE